MNLELQDLSINMLPNNNNKEKAPMFSECHFKILTFILTKFYL